MRQQRTTAQAAAYVRRRLGRPLSPDEADSVADAADMAGIGLSWEHIDLNTDEIQPGRVTRPGSRRRKNRSQLP